MLTVSLACFALGVWQAPPYEVENEVDAKGNSISGLYNPVTEEFVGSAQVVFAAGGVYDGGFEGNRFNGYGIFNGEDTLEDGTVLGWRFEGTFVEGRMEGEGSYSDSLGSYTGTFSHSLPDGYGVYASNSGWRYEGEFQAGSMTGKGTVTLADGSVSTGWFEDGLQISAE